jgi:hypothetical protein
LERILKTAVKPKVSAAAALKTAELERKAKVGALAQKNAEIESARIRAMFDEDRIALARRYGAVSITTKD